MMKLVQLYIGLLCAIWGFINCQCPSRNFTRHYLDSDTSIKLQEQHTRNKRECSISCAKNIDCVGFNGGQNDTCVMYYDVKRDATGSTPIWIEGDYPVSCHWHWNQANKTGTVLSDGVYQIWYQCHWMDVYCDMTADGGGWMLILSNTNPGRGWTLGNIRERNRHNPSLSVEYSILEVADNIRKRSKASTFQYRLETSGRGRWGGIWEAPRHYSLIDETGTQTSVTEIQQFDSYIYHDHNSIGLRVPWIDNTHPAALLTSKVNAIGNWYGTFVMKDTAPDGNWNPHGPAPIMEGGFNLVDSTWKTKISPIYYWFRMELHNAQQK